VKPLREAIVVQRISPEGAEDERHLGRAEVIENSNAESCILQQRNETTHMGRDAAKGRWNRPKNQNVEFSLGARHPPPGPSLGLSAASSPLETISWTVARSVSSIASVRSRRELLRELTPRAELEATRELGSCARGTPLPIRDGRRPGGLTLLAVGACASQLSVLTIVPSAPRAFLDWVVARLCAPRLWRFGMMSSLIDQTFIDGNAVSVRRIRQAIVDANDIVERPVSVARPCRKCRGSLLMRRLPTHPCKRLIQLKNPQLTLRALEDEIQ
jgi:hypothetical protein